MVADSQSKGKYKLVKALIRDECKECKANEIKLSNKAIKDINASKKANVIWAILSKEGKMKKGPIQPKLSEDEIIKMLKVFRVKKFDDLLERFTENAKYIAKRDKVRMKTLKGVKIEVIKKIANKKNKKVPVSKKITTAKKAAGGKKGKVIKTKVVKSVLTTKRVVVVTKARAATKVTPAKAKPTLSTINSTKNGKETSTGTLMTGAFAVSVAAGAALLFVRKRSAKKNYIFGEPLDKYDDKTAKELYARTKNGQKFKIQIPLNDFNDIAHIQIFSPRCKESNTDVYNVHTERAMMSDDNDSINTLPQPQEQPKPHAQLPIPANDFMMRFSLIEQPDLAALQKENIGAYDCTKITTLTMMIHTFLNTNVMTIKKFTILFQRLKM